MARRAFRVIVGLGTAVLLSSSGWGITLDFASLSGNVPDEYGGLSWIDPYLGNQWIVEPSHPPQNPTRCAVFDSGDMTVEATILSPTPIDFLSVDFAGLSGDVVQLFGHSPEREFSSETITLNGSTMVHYEANWLGITSLTIYYDSLFPGSTSLDNLTFRPTHHLATIFKEDFDSFSGDPELLAAGWELGHGQYPATGGGIWHLATASLETGSVSGVYIISDSDAEGELPPLQYMDERLISPEIDCTEFTEVHLEFQQNLKVYDENDYPEVFNLHISNDAAHETWQAKQVPFWNEAKGSSFYPQSIDISEFADGKKIKIRWRYTANFDFWWAIDNVRVIGRPKSFSVTGLHVVVSGTEVQLSWEAPDGSFTIEASHDASFPWISELATGIGEKQWTGSDPGVSEQKRYYRIRMD